MTISKISVVDYNAIPAERATLLKAMGDSPRRYKYVKENKYEPTSAMLLGTAVHTATLEPELFAKEYAVYPGPVRRGKEWEQWAARHADRTIITESEHELALAVSKAVRDDPVAARYLATGQPEMTLQWTNQETQLACKARLDWLIEAQRIGNDKPIIVGLKTAKSAHPRRFSTQAAQLGYHVQWGMYAAGYHAITGQQPEMIEIVVETAPFYEVVVYRIPQDVLDFGQEQMQEYLQKVVECTKSGKWPGIADGRELPFILPGWAMGYDDGAAIELDFT
jgi:exodeoxyribonuclease VIII